MSQVFPGRYTAQIDEPFVVFLIGVRINRLFALHHQMCPRALNRSNPWTRFADTPLPARVWPFWPRPGRDAPVPR
jgi:hypothetical protein